MFTLRRLDNGRPIKRVACKYGLDENDLVSYVRVFLGPVQMARFESLFDPKL